MFLQNNETYILHQNLKMKYYILLFLFLIIIIPLVIQKKLFMYFFDEKAKHFYIDYFLLNKIENLKILYHIVFYNKIFHKD